MGTMRVILCPGKGSGVNKGTGKNLGWRAQGCNREIREQGTLQQTGGVSVRDLSSKRSAVKARAHEAFLSPPLPPCHSQLLMAPPAPTTRPAPKVSDHSCSAPLPWGEGDMAPPTHHTVPAAFVSRRASAEVVQRQKRNYGYDR